MAEIAPDQAVEIFKVAADSEAVKVATSITKAYANGHSVSMRVIGAAAVNNAVKAAIIAGTFLRRDVIIRPAFCDIEVDQSTRTSIILDLIIEAGA